MKIIAPDKILKVEIENNEVSELARRTGDTPRIANLLLRRIRDYAQILRNGIITESITQRGVDEMEVNPLGLDEQDGFSYK